MSSATQGPVAVAFPSPPGPGGLGFLASEVLGELSHTEPGAAALGPSDGSPDREVREWHTPPRFVSPLAVKYTPLRWRSGDLEHLLNRRRARWTAARLAAVRPPAVYAFAQMALEPLRWARQAGIPAILDSPTGHIRHFREVGERESRRWCGARYREHPSPRMVARVEQEYATADHIRVASEWSKRTLVARGVPPDKVTVIPYAVDLARFAPPPERPKPRGPLSVCFVAGLSLHKGFAYLLEAARMIGARHLAIELVGGTGSRCCRQLLARERAGLDVTAGPVPEVREAYHRAELLVHPSLHDGFALVIAEAMGCALPIVASDSCGASALVEEEQTGWTVPAGRVDALATALEQAIRRRAELPAMGARGRSRVEEFVRERPRVGPWIAGLLGVARQTHPEA